MSKEYREEEQPNKTEVVMLKSVQGVNVGEIQPQLFEKGKTYEIGDSLLQNFISQGVVELVDGSKPKKAAPPVNKDKDGDGKPDAHTKDSLMKLNREKLVALAENEPYNLEINPELNKAGIADLILEIDAENAKQK